MQVKNVKYIIGFFLLTMFLWSCKKGLDESSLDKYQVGTNATVVDSIKVYVSGTTKEIKTPTKVSFEKQFVSFKFSLSEAATWYVEIVGKSSGATKRITGLSLGADSADAKWYGEADGMFYFSRNDTCTVKVTVLGSSISMLNTNLIIKDGRIDSTFILIADFEPYIKSNASASDKAKFCKINQISATTSVQPIVSAWNPFFDIHGAIKEEICGGFVMINDTCFINDNCGNKAGIIKPINGVGYFHLHGQDYSDEPNNYYIGGFNHDPVLYGINPQKTLDQIWVNFYANSFGNKATNLKVKFYGIGGDQFSREFSIDWMDWKLVSIRLSDLALEIAGPSAPGKLIPSQLKRMGFEMLCNRGAGSGCEAEVAIDYVTITYDKPFNPNSINK